MGAVDPRNDSDLSQTALASAAWRALAELERGSREQDAVVLQALVWASWPTIRALTQ